MRSASAQRDEREVEWVATQAGYDPPRVRVRAATNTSSPVAAKARPTPNTRPIHVTAWMANQRQPRVANSQNGQ